MEQEVNKTMVKFSEESKQKIEKYVKQGYLTQDIIFQIWRDYPTKKIITILKEHLFINEITLTKVWLHIIHTIWQDLDSIFDKREIILLKTLLWQDGVLLRTQIKNDSLNEYMTSKAIETLTERDIIDVLSFCKNQKIIILHPKFRHGIFRENTTQNENGRRIKTI